MARVDVGHGQCNPWCFGGVHAVFYDIEASEITHLQEAGKVLAAQNGMEFAGAQIVHAPGSAAVGTPTREGLARGRVVVFGRRG